MKINKIHRTLLLAACMTVVAAVAPVSARAQCANLPPDGPIDATLCGMSTGATDNSAAAVIWLDECMTLNRPCHLPAGTYKILSPIQIELDPNPTSTPPAGFDTCVAQTAYGQPYNARCTGINLYGDGATSVLQFNIPNGALVSPNTAALTVQCTFCATDADTTNPNYRAGAHGAFWSDFENFNISGTVVGTLLQVGLRPLLDYAGTAYYYPDAMNGITLRGISVTNTSTSASANAVELNGNYESRFYVNASNSGTGDALRVGRTGYSTISGTYSNATNGVHLIEAYGNTIDNSTISNVNTAVAIDDQATNNSETVFTITTAGLYSYAHDNTFEYGSYTLNSGQNAFILASRGYANSFVESTFNGIYPTIASGNGLTGVSLIPDSLFNFDCKLITDACENAGYVLGSGLTANCYNPLLAGQTGAPLPALDPKTVPACNAELAADPAAPYYKAPFAPTLPTYSTPSGSVTCNGIQTTLPTPAKLDAVTACGMQAGSDDPTVTSANNTAIAAWASKCISLNIPCYLPSGTYYLSAQFTVDLAAAPTTGISIYGDGSALSGLQFDISVPSPNMTIKCSTSCTANHVSLSNMLVAFGNKLSVSTTGGNVLQVGSLNLSDQINNLNIDNVRVSDFSTSTSANAIEFNNVTWASVWMTANNYGYGDALSLKDVTNSQFEGSFATSNIGLHIDDADTVGNMFRHLDTEVTNTGETINAAAYNNTWISGVNSLNGNNNYANINATAGSNNTFVDLNFPQFLTYPIFGGGVNNVGISLLRGFDDCTTIMNACLAYGFASDYRDVVLDCLVPLLNGQTLGLPVIDTRMIAACNAESPADKSL